MKSDNSNIKEEKSTILTSEANQEKSYQSMSSKIKFQRLEKKLGVLKFLQHPTK